MNSKVRDLIRSVKFPTQAVNVSVTITQQNGESKTEVIRVKKSKVGKIGLLTGKLAYELVKNGRCSWTDSNGTFFALEVQPITNEAKPIEPEVQPIATEGSPSVAETSDTVHTDTNNNNA